MKFINNKLCLFVTALFLWISLYSFTSYYIPYLSSLNFSNSTIGLIAGSFGFASLFLKLPLGIIADTIKKYKIFINIGLLLSFLSSIIMLNSISASFLLAARVLNGITSSIWIVFYTMFASNESTNESSKLQSIQFLGEFLGIIISGIVYQNYGIHGTFRMFILTAGLAFIFSLFLSDEGINKEPITKKDLILVLKDRNMQICATLATLYQFCIFATAYHFTQSLVADMGGTGLQLSYVSSIRLIISSLSCRAVLFTFFKNRSDAFNLYIGFGTLAFYCIFVPLCINIQQIYVVSMIGGISSGFSLSYLMSKSLDNTPETARTAGMGFFQCVYSLGVTFGPIIMGILLEKTTGYFPAFAFIGILSILTGILSAIIMPKRLKY